jgi:hypothetical protein
MRLFHRSVKFFFYVLVMSPIFGPANPGHLGLFQLSSPSPQFKKSARIYLGSPSFI